MHEQFGQAKTYIDNVKDSILHEITEKGPSGIVTGTGAGGFGLVNPKEMVVAKLHDGMRKDEFVHWRSCMDTYLDNDPGGSIMGRCYTAYAPSTKSRQRVWSFKPSEMLTETQALI